MNITSTSPAPAAVAAIPTEQLDQLITNAFGPGWRVEDSVKLNHKTEVQVFRLSLSGPAGVSKSVILKCAGPNPFTGHYLPDFTEEQLNYQYLEQLRPRFEHFPAHLGQQPGLLLMEDLGPDSYEFPSLEDIVNALVATLYNLHDSSCSTLHLYGQLRKNAGLGTDERRYGIAGCARMFEQGCKQLCEFAGLLGLRASALQGLLHEAGTRILNPGTFWAFVHDDLADRRQSVVVNGTIKLLDFEHGKFFHRLIDLAKLLMGKIERDNEKKAMIYHHPHVPVHIGQVYYDRWRQNLAAPTAEEFLCHFAAANIFQTMLIIGRLVELQGPEMLYSMAGNLKMILPRLVQHLEQGTPDHFTKLRGLLVEFCQRIMI